jgi:hypothetical protein
MGRSDCSENMTGIGHSWHFWELPCAAELSTLCMKYRAKQMSVDLKCSPVGHICAASLN